MNRRNFLYVTGAATPSIYNSLAQPNSELSEAKRKLFIYGGDFDARFTKYVASLTGKENPKVCFLPTATGDAPGYITRWFESCSDLALRPYVQRAFISSYSQKDSFETAFSTMDAIIVGGGNTLNMIAIWKAQGIDKALKNAWDRGVVLSGGSAGSLCWFEHGTSDSRPAELTKVDGLGFMSGSHCPHYHAEPGRKPLYWSKIKSGEYKPGYACDDRAGIYFENNELKQVVSLDEQSNAYYVSLEGGEVKENLLPKQIIKL